MSIQYAGPRIPRWRRTAAVLAHFWLTAGFLASPGASQVLAPDAAAEPLRMEGEVRRPELISKGPGPVYTEEARRARVQGTVIVEAVIDRAGNVASTRVVKGLPMGLDQAAVDAVKTWRFKPATLDGKPVPVYYVLTVRFQVGGEPYQGPAYLAFLRDHPDFAAALAERRDSEAAALLARLEPVDAAAGLARIYLLLQQQRLESAWQAAGEHRGPHRGEAMRAVAAYARHQGQDSSRDAAARKAAIELGIEAADQAIQAAPEDDEAFSDKGILLREKAHLSTGEGERQRLFDEAERLWARARELRKARPEPDGTERKP